MKWFSIILFFALVAQAAAQNNPAMAYNPDYVVLETHLFAKNDTNYSFLFKPNEESYNKKPFVWQFLDIRFDRSLAYDYHEILRTDKKRPLKPINFDKVDKLLVRYAVFYKDGKIVYVEPAELVVMEYIDYLEDEEPAYFEIFSVTDQKSLLMYWLDAKFIPGRNAVTYWEFFISEYENAPLQYISFCSLDYAEKLTNKNIWAGFTYKKPSFVYPKKIMDNAKLEIHEIVPLITDSILRAQYGSNEIENYDLLSFSDNFTLFFPFENKMGYKNLSHLICSGISREDFLFFEYSNSEFFHSQLNADQLREIIHNSSGIHRIDLELPPGMKKESTYIVFESFRILILNSEGHKYPVAIAPVSSNDDKPLFWLLFNEGFQKLLFGYEALIPGKSAISLGEYFEKMMFESKLISQESIHQDGWKEIFRKLK